MILLATWAGCAAYLFAFLHRGWIVSDEGLLGHCAERVLQGELPHVDFRDPYTGGLSFFHALAFRLFGVQILATRFAVYFAALLFLLVVFRLARRIAPPPGAAAFTLLAMVWSLPNYFSAMPSWYVLFLATGALLALVKHIESGRRRWLVLAGILVGTSFAAKPTGLLFFAAALLFLVYREQETEQETDSETEPEPGQGVSTGAGVLAFRLFVTSGLTAFVASLLLFFRHRPRPMEYLHFVVPGAALAIFLLVRVWRRPSGPAVRRLRRLTVSGGLFLAGFLLPPAALLAPYARRGAMDVWLDPHLLFQSERLEFVIWVLPGIATLICALPWAVLFFLPLVREGRRDDSEPSPTLRRTHRLGLALAALAATLVLALSIQPFVYQTVWFSLRPLVPILVLSGVAWLALRAAPASAGGAAAGSARRQTVFLTLAFTALASISQFPYSRAYYFCYLAPLVALSWLFVADRLATGKAARALHATLGVFFGLFAVLWLNLGWVETMDHGFRPLDHSRDVALDRAQGLRSEAGRTAIYEELVDTIQALTRPEESILVLADSPEVYFFADRRNPTRTLFDFLDDDFGHPERDQRLGRLLDTHDIRVVVIRRHVVFSPLPQGFLAEVARRFPGRRNIGPFSVHWREPVDGADSAAVPDTGRL